MKRIDILFHTAHTLPLKLTIVAYMGEAPDDAPVPILFHNRMWEKLNPVIGRSQRLNFKCPRAATN